MRLVTRSILRKACCGLRYILVRLWHRKTFSGSWISFIDSRCCIYVDSPSARIEFGNHVFVGSGSWIQSAGRLVIGDHVFMNTYARIVAREHIELGAHCLLGSQVSILDHDHATDLVDGQPQRERFETAPIIIGNNVWIGDKVTILKGVTVGDNCVIGANAVVTRSIPTNSVAVGSPAKVVRTLTERQQSS